MPTLNLDLDFIDHPKVKRLIARTGHEGVTCLLRLWGYVGKFHKIDGSLSSYTPDEIEQFAGWTGMRGALLQALLDVNLLDPDKTIHDWQDHAGHLAAYQSRAKVMAKAKWDAVRNATSNAISSPISNATRNASSVQFSSLQDSSVQFSSVKSKEKYAASPPYVTQTKTWKHEDPEFYDECVYELSEAIEVWFPKQKSPKQRGQMAGFAVNKLNRVIRVHPKALLWIIENKMRVPETPNLWVPFVKTADKTMHKGGKFPDGNLCPPLLHEWESEARRACPLIPRIEVKQ